jgi:hypothetical protein
LALVGVVVAASVQVRFWEVAPGSAEPVADRLGSMKKNLTFEFEISIGVCGEA